MSRERSGLCLDVIEHLPGSATTAPGAVDSENDEAILTWHGSLARGDLGVRSGRPESTKL